MTCRQLGIDRAVLIQAITGKTSARQVTRDEALEVLTAAREIADGKRRLTEEAGIPILVEVEQPSEQEDMWDQWKEGDEDIPDKEEDT